MTPQEYLFECIRLIDPTLPKDHLVLRAAFLHLGRYCGVEIPTEERDRAIEANFRASGLWTDHATYTEFSLESDEPGSGDLAILLDGMVGAGLITAIVTFKLPEGIAMPGFGDQLFRATVQGTVWTDQVAPVPDARNIWQQLIKEKILRPTGETRPSTIKNQKGRRVRQYAWTPLRGDCLEIKYQNNPGNELVSVTTHPSERAPNNPEFIKILRETRSAHEVAEMYRVTPYYVQKWERKCLHNESTSV